MVHARIIIQDYKNERDKILQEEIMSSVGGRLIINEDEIKANNILMNLKRRELDNSFHDTKNFNFSKHYFAYKNNIEKSKVYQTIRRMPKGAALHIHNSQMLDADNLLKLTYEDHLYACYADDDLKLHFSYIVPNLPCSVEWTLLSDLRNSSNNVTAFDSKLKKQFTMYNEYDQHHDTDINKVWKRFDKVYNVIKSLISYRPVREKYFYASLKNFYEDNIMYIEIRSGLHSLYELNGTVHDKLYLAELYRSVTKAFIKDHPDFIGIKIILTKHRKVTLKQVNEGLGLARKLKLDMPDLFAGFDLVGQEDLGKPLLDFLPALAEAKDEINYYFHGGETNWFGTSSDENLVDAILLGSKRIGHAYALIKHPHLLATIKEKDIALEINVLSNSVLALIGDVRNHPLATYLALGLPVVLSSDDPGAWGAEPLSHDFYVAFMGIASKHSDLRLLKQLAINSIRYSALDDVGKTKLFRVFNTRWSVFIQEIIEKNDLLPVLH